MYLLEIKLTTEHNNVVYGATIEASEDITEVEAIKRYLESIPERIKSELEDITIITRRLS